MLLSFFLNLLLLNFVFKHLLSSCTRFLYLFYSLFFFGLKQTYSIVQLSSMQIFLMFELARLSNRVYSKHSQILYRTSSLSRRRAFVNYISLTVTFFKFAFYGILSRWFTWIWQKALVIIWTFFNTVIINDIIKWILHSFFRWLNWCIDISNGTIFLRMRCSNQSCFII